MATIPSRPAIAAAGLRKSFGDQVVLDGIDLEVPEGTSFALLGPNGAGKTTKPAATGPRPAGRCWHRCAGRRRAARAGHGAGGW